MSSKIKIPLVAILLALINLPIATLIGNSALYKSSYELKQGWKGTYENTGLMLGCYMQGQGNTILPSKGFPFVTERSGYDGSGYCMPVKSTNLSAKIANYLIILIAELIILFCSAKAINISRFKRSG